MKTRAKVVIGREKSQEFEITLRVKQSDALFVMLFNLSLDQAIKKYDLTGHIFQRKRQLGDMLIMLPWYQGI